MSHKRIYNEIKKMKQETHYIPDEDVLHIYLSAGRVVTLTHLASYPFQAPKIFLNDEPYKKYLIFASLRLENAYKKWYSSLLCCLQCESFDCSFRWSVFCRFQNILDEISLLFQRKRIVTQLVLLDTLFYEKNLPQDILHHIAVFLLV